MMSQFVLQNVPLKYKHSILEEAFRIQQFGVETNLLFSCGTFDYSKERIKKSSSSRIKILAFIRN